MFYLLFDCIFFLFVFFVERILDIPNKRRLSSDQMAQIQVFNVKPVPIHVLLEMEDTIERIPMIKTEMEIGGSFNSVDDRFQIDSNIKIHAFCYNASRGNWEPLIELSTKDDLVYQPWEISIKVRPGQQFLWRIFSRLCSSGRCTRRKLIDWALAVPFL